MPLLSRRAILGSVLAKGIALARSDQETVALAKTMESRDGLTIFTLHDAVFHRWHGARTHVGMTVWPAISPDARAMCWGEEDILSVSRPEGHFLTVNSLNSGIRTVPLDAHVPDIKVLTSGAEHIVARALSLKDRGMRRLLILDLGPGLAVRDLTPSVTAFPMASLRHMSVSGSGKFLALGSDEKIQVLEIPSGNSLYAGDGWIPRLSPDGKRLAFIAGERLYTRSLLDGSTIELLPHIRAMGVGGWSPDGRFLLAGAWTRRFASEKRQIILDTTTGHYGVIGTLGEGDYGEKAQWVAVQLMDR